MAVIERPDLTGMAWYTKFFYHISFCLVAMIVSLSLYRTPGVSAQKCSDLNPDIDLKAEWWCIPPYASRQAGSMQNGTNIEGKSFLSNICTSEMKS